MSRIPNFLFLGPDKSGSTWLHEVLIKHPDVYLSPAKDLYFFDRYFDRGEEWYLRQFVDAGEQTIVGEVCQDYLASPEAPGRIREVLGIPKLMVTLRDPADRAFSSYLYMRKHGLGPESFRQAVESYPEFLDHGRYGTQLARYGTLFPADSIYLGVFDDLKADPQAFLDGVLEWLGIGALELPPEDLSARLPASRARWVPVARFARRSADVVRALDGAELVGRVKRSPLVQHLLYRPLVDGEVKLGPADREWIQEQLFDEVAMVDDVYGLGLIQRWAW